jgi:hypothetical protein
MLLNKGLVVQFVGVMDDRDALLANRIADAIDPGDQDQPTRDALPLNGHPDTLPFDSGVLRTIPEHDTLAPIEVAMFFRFPPDARWNPERAAVEFSIGVGEYDGTVSVSRRVFQSLLGESPTPQRCVEAYYVQRTRLELIAERKVRRRQLTDTGDVEITGRDLREREPLVAVGAVVYRAAR